jgi:hypothetical protein
VYPAIAARQFLVKNIPAARKDCWRRRFPCDPCRIKLKQAINSSQKFLFKLMRSSFYICVSIYPSPPNFSFSVWSLSYQRKVDDWFFSELIVLRCVTHRPTPEDGGPPLVDLHHSLFNIEYLQLISLSGGRLLLPPFRGDK